MIRRSLWSACVSLLLLACDGASAPASDAPADPAQRGRTLYGAYCADCHGGDGRGGGPRAAGLASPPPDLSTIANRNGGLFIDDAVAAYIDGRRLVEAHGPRDMPVWGRSLDDRNTELGGELRLTPDMIDAIVQHVRSLQRDPKASPS